MDILRIKKAHLPPPTTTIPRKKKERKVTSAAAVDDADGETGSSNGPDTPSAAQSRDISSDEDSDETDSDS